MKLPLSAIQRSLPKRIWQQIFLILVFLVVIPLVTLGILLIYTSQKAVKTTVFSDYQEIATHATGEIREYVKGPKQALSVSAAILGRLQEDSWRQETVIVELALTNPAYERISSIDLSGKEIVTSELGAELHDYSREEAFQEALKGHSYISAVKISKDYIPFITFSEPIRQLGRVKGALMADLNLRGVWQLVDAIKIGQHGKVYIIDGQGLIIAHPDKELVFKNSNITRPEVIQNILRGQSGNFQDVDEKGMDWLTFYAPIEGLNWGLIIAQPTKEVFASSNQMRWQSAILIIISILFTIVMSLILAGYMSRPMRDIIEGTQRLADGDFSQTFRIKSRNEIGRLLFSFNRMKDRLYHAQQTEKLSIIGKAATAVAHDLKNSLVLIQTFIELLPERHNDKEFIKEFSDIIPKELESWNTSLRNMMRFSKNSECVMEDVNVEELLLEVCLLIRLKTRQRNIRFETQFQEGILKIRGNKDKLKQLMLNLLTNALEATPDGGFISMRIQLTGKNYATDVQYLEMEITDTGEGITSENLEKIFDPFFSTKTSGLGLGLAISKEIVEQHGGQIKATSHENQQTSFLVRLPTTQNVKKSLPRRNTTSIALW